MNSTSNEIDKISEALSLAQGEFKEFKMTGENPHFKSRYSKLSDIRNATQEALAKHGLSFVQMPYESGGFIVIESRLLHKSGQWLANYLPMKPDKPTPQGIGSAITYGRRYAKAAMLGAEGEDDDGNEAEGLNQYRKTIEEQDKLITILKKEVSLLNKISDGFSKKGIDKSEMITLIKYLLDKQEPKNPITGDKNDL